MAISPEIVFGLKSPQVADPLQQASQAVNLIGGVQRARAGAQELEQGALQLQQQKRAITEADQMRQLFSSVPVDEKTGRPNLRAILPDVLKINPATGQSMMKGLHDQEKADADFEKAQFETESKKAEQLGAIAGTITDEGSFHRGIASALARRVIDPRQADALVAQGWSEKTAAQVKQIAEESISAKEKADLKFKQYDEDRKALEASHQAELRPFEVKELRLKTEAAEAERYAADHPEDAAAQRRAMSASQAASAEAAKKNAENNVSEFELRLRAAKGDPVAKKALEDASREKIRVAQAEAQNRRDLQMGSLVAADGSPSETARAIADYQVPFSQATSRLPAPARDALLKQVRGLNPDFQASNYDTFKAMEKDATSGKIATTANSQSTAIAHLEVLNQAVDALNNGNIKALNQLGNSLGVQVGQTPKTTFEAIVHKVGPELASAYLAGGGSAGERGATEKDFDPSLSPAALKSNIAVSAKLLEGKIKANQEQYGRGTYGRGKQKLITPEAEAALKRLAGKSDAPQKGDRRSYGGHEFVFSGTDWVKQ